MIRVNKKHSVQYVHGHFRLREFGKTKDGKESVKGTEHYLTLEDMILNCGFEMDYSYTDAALKSKAECESGFEGH